MRLSMLLFIQVAVQNAERRLRMIQKDTSFVPKEIVIGLKKDWMLDMSE